MILNKSILLAITICLITTGNTMENENRTQYFPKVELNAGKIPDKNNTWVFILAGQSNMAGRGFVEPQDTIPNERVFTINKNGEVIIAKEPLHFYEPIRTGLDCGLSFGNTLCQHIPDSISFLIIPTAIGGSSTTQWLGDSLKRNVKLLTNFKEKVKIGMKYGQIKGILWHQGEADANPESVPLYKNRLSKLFSEFRQIVNNEELSILIGELGVYSDNENWLKINEQIHLYAATDSNVTVINTSDLKEKGDKEHFNSAGQRIMGERFANAFIKMVK